MAAKVIVLGSLNGKLESAFQKLATLHKKQNFSFAIITGNLFDVDPDDGIIKRLLDGSIPVPVTTYFTIGTTPLPDRIVERVEKGEDICENLHFLGKRSITKTSDGIRIVALGGILDKTIVGGQSKEQHLPFHTSDDAKALRGANSADILLTTTWPSSVWVKSQAPLTPQNLALVPSTEEVAELCAALKPRYHFCPSPAEFFFEREPFFHPPSAPDSDVTPTTRFLSLAPYGNTSKAKALYAFNIAAGDSNTAIPTGSTASPFLSRSNPRKRPAPDADSHSNGRVDHYDGGRRTRRRRNRSPPPGPDRCFFCLSNTEVDTHMICSIGDDSYVTTAKGPLSNTFAGHGLPFPGHQLIIPLPHEPTVRAMGEDADKTYKEMTRFKESMQAMIASKSNYKLGCVTWEIGREKGIHVHWQFLPAPVDLLRKGLVEAGFRVEAENQKYPPFEETDLGPGLDETGDFFRVWIWSDDSDTGIQSKELVMRLPDDTNAVRFDLQFGRRVMAKLLGLEDRLYWQDVVQSLPEETSDVEAFKEAFKPWDFTMA
ncbi:CwfJ C-terminus 1-domain-containing protein-like protein [Xylariomycetidae sp. FL2044]|nr:CwfJ C-terminus 1-domain-containing protein-like protein [Xylariomycetidae sp. FL2044]